MTLSLLDRLHAETSFPGEETAAWMTLYSELLATQLFLLRDTEGEGAALAVFALDEGPIAIGFDQEDRLARFAEGPAELIALPGRGLLGVLSEQGLGLGVNLDSDTHGFVLSAETVRWLAKGSDATAPGPAEGDLGPPPRLDLRAQALLDRNLARAGGMAASVSLVTVGDVPALIFRDCPADVAPQLATMVGDIARFSVGALADLTVVFVSSETPISDQAARLGMTLALPRPQKDLPKAPGAPGTDPERPPKLR